MALPCDGRAIETLSSSRSKIWALQTPPVSLLGAPPCGVQGKNPGQTQTSGLEAGEHIPSSLKSGSHLPQEIQKSQPPSPYQHPWILPEVLSETAGSATSVKLTASQQAETGKGRSCGDRDICSHTSGPNTDKIQLGRAAGPTMGAAKVGGISHKLWITCSFE